MYNTTITGNISNKVSYNEVSERHLDHNKPKKDKNKFLYTDESLKMRKYNFNENYLDQNGNNYEKAFSKTYKNAVEKHNAREEKSRHFDRVYESVLDYGLFNSKGKRRMSKKRYDKKLKKWVEPAPVFPDQAYMLKLGSQSLMLGVDPKTHCAYQDIDPKNHKDGWLNQSLRTLMAQGLTQGQAMDKIQQAVADGFRDYNHEFNKSYRDIHMYEMYYHSDEEGYTPHEHARLGVFTETGAKRKKMSWSFPKALDNAVKYGELAEVYEDEDPKKPLKGVGRQLALIAQFRDIEDKRLIKCVNQQLEQQVPEVERFKLVRTHETEIGLEHDAYKHKMNKKRLDAQAEVMTQNKNTITSQEATKSLNALELSHQANVKANNSASIATQKNTLNDLNNQVQAQSQRLAIQANMEKDSSELQATIDKQKQEIAENQNKLNNLANYESLVSTYNETIQSKQATIAYQNQTIKDNKEKLDRLNTFDKAQKDYDDLQPDLLDAKATIATAKKYDKATVKKQKEEAEMAEAKRKEAEAKAKEAEQRQLNASAIATEKMKKVVKAKENEYKKKLKDRKKALLAKENADYKAKLKKAKDIQNKKLDELSKARPKEYSLFKRFKNLYHKCAETFISTIDPTTQDHFRGNPNNPTIAHLMAHGNYREPLDPKHSNLTSFEYIVEATRMQGAVKRFLPAVKKTFGVLADAIHDKRFIDDVRAFDHLPEKEFNTAINLHEQHARDEGFAKLEQEFAEDHKQAQAYYEKYANEHPEATQVIDNDNPDDPNNKN